MKYQAMKLLTVLSIAAVCVSVFYGPARADSNQRTGAGGGRIRLQGVFIMPLGENHIELWNDCGPGWFDLLNFSSSIDVNTTGGLLASFEYVFREKYGIEAGFVYWREFVDLNFEATGLTIHGSPNFIMPTIGANYHFLSDEKKDLYAGGLCCLGVIATGMGTDIEISKDIALGLNLGADYYVHDSWSAGIALKYLDFGEMDFSLLPPGLEGIICDNGLFGIGHLNCISVTAGIGYRF